MSEMTAAIAKIKTAVSQEEWRQRIEACQNSEMKVKDWCEKNEVTVGRYYDHLRKLREVAVEENQIVPLRQPETEGTCRIQIQVEDLQICLPETATPEQLQAIVCALKPC